MKLIIEVSGGNITNIIATEEISIHLIDHDNLKAGKSIATAQQAFPPNFITTEEEFLENLNQCLDVYKSKESK